MYGFIDWLAIEDNFWAMLGLIAVFWMVASLI